MVKKRVCVVGCGPSGMAFMHHWAKLKMEEKEEEEMGVEVVCFEKQADWGGLWNYTWRTGIGEGGEPVHNGMYRHLWINAAKEADLEYPDYSFEKHFGKKLPSYVPREVIAEYLKGRFSQYDFRQHIRFSCIVSNIAFEESSGQFVVSSRDLGKEEEEVEERFDYVVDCAGHFSIPNVPEFEGISSFPGRVMHSHDFRHAREFAGQDLLVIGSSYSADDIAVQSIKFGAKSVICSYRSKAMGFKWPKSISERPLLVKVEGNRVIFKDGSDAKVDTIIMATGYLHHYPYLRGSLRLTGPNTFYPTHLYRGIVWLKGGNSTIGHLLHLGKQDQEFSFTMFDVQALWALRWIRGDIERPSLEVMEEDTREWVTRVSTLKDDHDKIDFQLAYMKTLALEAAYPLEIDSSANLHKFVKDRETDILTFRDQRFPHLLTGELAPEPKIKFMDYLDDIGLESYLGMY